MSLQWVCDVCQKAVKSISGVDLLPARFEVIWEYGLYRYQFCSVRCINSWLDENMPKEAK